MPAHKKYFTDEERITANRKRDALSHKKHRANNPEKTKAQLRASNAKRKENGKAAAYNRDAAKHRSLQRNYGITLDDYNRMFIEQGGRCAICGVHQSKLNKSLNVDHNHETGVVRGLLCHHCNTALGLLKDSSQVISCMGDYLGRYE